MAELGSRTFRARLFAVLALVALGATYLTPIIDADWNAWRYDHGHASMAAVGQHSHPWENSGAAATNTVNAEGADGVDGDDGGFVYTASGDSVPGITAIWTPSTATVVTLLSDILVESDVVSPPRVEVAAPLSPPPEAPLSHI